MKIGVIGAGTFAGFSVESFLNIDGVSCGGVYDINKHHAEKLAGLFKCKVYNELEELLQDKDITLIYISTPPYLHHEQSKTALLAGKHVVCEKPAALKPGEAEELYRIAEEKNLLYVVNLMQRYNPIYQKVKDIIDKKILGDFLHGFFENYASDDTLVPGHWMWDESKSGGIFIEHGVHFFDMFSGWYGQGKVIAAQKIQRPEYKDNLFNRVQAIVKYQNGIVNFYHGFDQPLRFDRQELRLLFERGDITLYEWVPTKVILNGIISTAELKELKSIFQEAKISISENYHGDKRLCKGNFKQYKVDHKVELKSGENTCKSEVYKYMLTEMFRDQLEWIRDRSHKRIITASNGINSLSMAYTADKIAVEI